MSFIDSCVLCLSAAIAFAAATPASAAQRPDGFVPELIKVEAATTEVAPGKSFEMTYYWRNIGTQPSFTNQLIGVHVRQNDIGFFNPDGGCWINGRSKDYKGRPQPRPFQGDYYPAVPTTRWMPDQVIAEGPYAIAVPEDAPEGSYDVLVLPYDRGGRLRLAESNASIKSPIENYTSYKAGSIRVSKTAETRPATWTLVGDAPSPAAEPAPAPVSDIKATRAADAAPDWAGELVMVGDKQMGLALDKSRGLALACVYVNGTAFEGTGAFPSLTIYDKNGSRLQLAPDDTRWKVSTASSRGGLTVRYALDGFEASVVYRVGEGGATATVTPTNEKNYKALLLSSAGSMIAVPADKADAVSSAFLIVPTTGGHLIRFPSTTQQSIANMWQAVSYPATFFGIGYNGCGLIVRCPQFGATWSYGTADVNGRFALMGEFVEAFRPSTQYFDMPRPEHHIDVQFEPVGDVNKDGVFNWVDVGVTYRQRFIRQNKGLDKKLRDSVWGKIDVWPSDSTQNYSQLIEQLRAIDFAPQTWWLVGAHTPPSHGFEAPGYLGAPDPRLNGPGGYDYFAFKKDAAKIGARIGLHELYQDISNVQPEWNSVIIKTNVDGKPKATWGGLSDGNLRYVAAKALPQMVADGSFFRDLEQHFKRWGVRPGDSWHWDCLSAMCGQQDYDPRHPSTNGTDYRAAIQIAKYMQDKGIHFTSEGLQEGMAEYLDMGWGTWLNWSKPGGFDNADWVPLTPVLFQGTTYYAFSWYPGFSLLVGGKPGYEKMTVNRDELVGGYFGSNVYWQLIADRTVNNIIKSDKGWRTEYTQGGSLTVTPAEIGPEMQFVLEIDGNTYTADNPPPSTWGVTAKKVNGKYELTYPKGKPGAK